MLHYRSCDITVTIVLPVVYIICMYVPAYSSCLYPRERFAAALPPARGSDVLHAAVGTSSSAAFGGYTRYMVHAHV